MGLRQRIHTSVGYPAARRRAPVRIHFVLSSKASSLLDRPMLPPTQRAGVGACCLCPAVPPLPTTRPRTEPLTAAARPKHLTALLRTVEQGNGPWYRPRRFLGPLARGSSPWPNGLSPAARVLCEDNTYCASFRGRTDVATNRHQRRQEPSSLRLPRRQRLAPRGQAALHDLQQLSRGTGRQGDVDRDRRAHGLLLVLPPVGTLVLQPEDDAADVPLLDRGLFQGLLIAIRVPLLGLFPRLRKR